tara:strand:+ start:1549 stop:2316 length:768 start_codon:yes stop_codon:yes gene_type:complete
MNWKFWKKQSDKLEFWTEYPPLSDPSLSYLWPQPASKLFPEWIKDVPKEQPLPEQFRKNIFEKTFPTIKKCPVFAETLVQGVIIPLWQDYKILINEDLSYHWEGRVKHHSLKIDVHPNPQYINFLPQHERDRLATTLKFVCPWHIKTPPGWSCYQMPLYYHFQDWSVLLGSIRTDTHHEINTQVAFPKSLIGKEILIPRGTPWAWYVPYKRQTLGLEHIEYDPIMSQASWYSSISKFYDGYTTSGKKDRKDTKKG